MTATTTTIQLCCGPATDGVIVCGYDEVIMGKPLPYNPTAQMVARASKFGNRWTRCKADHNHQSAKEANRCNELRLLERGGEIEELKCQQRFKLEIDGEKITTYVADFTYIDARTRTFVVEDVKGRHDSADVAYKLYLVKKRLMKAIRGFEIREV